MPFIPSICLGYGFLNAAAFTTCTHMAVAARISWLQGQIAAGRAATFTCRVSNGMEKVKVLLGPPVELQTRLPLCASLVLESLQAVAHDARYVITDRGHRHSDGVSAVAFWLRSSSDPLVRPPQLRDDHHQPHHHGPRRGRSPPSGHHPAADPLRHSGSDPSASSASSARSPPSKAPRTHAKLLRLENVRSGLQPIPEAIEVVKSHDVDIYQHRHNEDDAIPITAHQSDQAVKIDSIFALASSVLDPSERHHVVESTARAKLDTYKEKLSTMLEQLRGSLDPQQFLACERHVAEQVAEATRFAEASVLQFLPQDSQPVRDAAKPSPTSRSIRSGPHRPRGRHR